MVPVVINNANLLPKLFRGPCAEVAVMAEVASKDAQTVTAGNIGYLDTQHTLDNGHTAEAKERDGQRRQRFQESECWLVCATAEHWTILCVNMFLESVSHNCDTL